MRPVTLPQFLRKMSAQKEFFSKCIRKHKLGILVYLLILTKDKVIIICRQVKLTGFFICTTNRPPDATRV